MSLIICSRDEVMADDVPLYGWAHEDKGVLASCAFKGDVDNMKIHLTKKNVNERGIRGYSPLMWAVTRGKMEAVEFLLNSGANVNHRDDVGTTPLHVAAWHGRKQIAQALIDNGANVNAYTSPREGGRNYHTPLHFACRGAVQANTVMRLLINSGADLEARNGKDSTPLHLANNPKKAEVLLKAGAKVNAPDRRGDSLLHTASSRELIRLLLEFGADVDMENEEGKTPLQTPCGPQDIKLFLEYGAGSRVICNQWGCGCGKTVLMCCYGSSLWGFAPKFTWCEDSVEAFEQHIIRTKVCGLYLGENNDPSVNPHPFIEFPAAKREEYRRICEAEFGRLSDEIPNMTVKVTYKDVLYQRPFALRERSMKKVLTLEHCQAKFPEYGGFVYARFITGLRRLNLVNRCLNFFNLATPPLPLPHFIVDVCAYLDDEDLQELGIVCAAAKKRRIPLTSSKGGNSAQQGSTVSKKKRPIRQTSSKGGSSAQHSSDVSVEKRPIRQTSSKGGSSAQNYGSDVSVKKRPIRQTSSKGGNSAQQGSTVSTKKRPIRQTSSKGGSSVQHGSDVSVKKRPIRQTSSKGGSSAHHGSDVSVKKRPIRQTSSKGGSSAQHGSDVSVKKRPIRQTSSKGGRSALQGSSASMKETPGTSLQRSNKDFPESSEKRSISGSEQRSLRSKRCISDDNQPGPISGATQQNLKRSKREK